jgi:hypothetical protein
VTAAAACRWALREWQGDYRRSASAHRRRGPLVPASSGKRLIHRCFAQQRCSSNATIARTTAIRMPAANAHPRLPPRLHQRHSRARGALVDSRPATTSGCAHESKATWSSSQPALRLLLLISLDPKGKRRIGGCSGDKEVSRAGSGQALAVSFTGLASRSPKGACACAEFGVGRTARRYCVWTRARAPFSLAAVLVTTAPRKGPRSSAGPPPRLGAAERDKCGVELIVSVERGGGSCWVAGARFAQLCPADRPLGARVEREVAWIRRAYAAG